MDVLNKLTKDIKEAAKTLSRTEARWLVDAYYQQQDYRRGAQSQIRSIDMPVFYDEDGKKKKPTEEEIEASELAREPHEAIDAYLKNVELLESHLKATLGSYSEGSAIGRWIRSIHGIGPVIAAGLMAHIDISKCETTSNIINYAGLNPEIT